MKKTGPAINRVRFICLLKKPAGRIHLNGRCLQAFLAG